MRRILIDFLGIALGTAIYAFGTQGFVVSVKLGGGGVSGLALLAYYLFAFPISITTILLNLPLLVIGWREIGKRFIIRTAFGVLASSVFFELFKGLTLVPNGDILLGALYGGVIQGIGGALVLRFEGSSGGMDIVAKVLNLRYGYSMGNVMLIANIAVIIISWVVLGGPIAMYTLVSLYVASRVLDAIVEGIPAKSAMIISDKGDLIAEKIISQIKRGVTVIRGQGGFTKENKEVLLCVVALTELVRIKRLVKDIDPNAFVVVNDAKEVLGKGFAKLGD